MINFLDSPRGMVMEKKGDFSEILFFYLLNEVMLNTLEHFIKPGRPLQVEVKIPFPNIGVLYFHQNVLIRI